MPALIDRPPRILFFTGKGGVGKTSAACATAIALADAGRRVLLVSTDPASNLDEVLGVALGASPTVVPGVPGLSALNIDPDEAARAYRERVVGPYRSVLPAAAVASIEEQLSGACTVEIAAFDEFSKQLGDADATREFDHVIFDTAPTGHTLRLLKLPAAWSTFIDRNVGGTSCLGPLSGLKAQHALYAASHAALRDRERTTLILVARPDTPSLTEAERTRSELHELGLQNVRLILNGVFHAQRAIRSPSRWKPAETPRSRTCPPDCARCRASTYRSSPSVLSAWTPSGRWASSEARSGIPMPPTVMRIAANPSTLSSRRSRRAGRVS